MAVRAMWLLSVSARAGRMPKRRLRLPEIGQALSSLWRVGVFVLVRLVPGLLPGERR